MKPIEHISELSLICILQTCEIFFDRSRSRMLAKNKEPEEKPLTPEEAERKRLLDKKKKAW